VVPRGGTFLVQYTWCSLCRIIRLLSTWCRAAAFFSASAAALSQEIPTVKGMSNQPALWTPGTTRYSYPYNDQPGTLEVVGFVYVLFLLSLQPLGRWLMIFRALLNMMENIIPLVSGIESQSSILQPTGLQHPSLHFNERTIRLKGLNLASPLAGFEDRSWCVIYFVCADTSPRPIF
jgi:hypothetical protein